MKSEPNADQERPIDWRKLPRICTTHVMLKARCDSVLDHVPFETRQKLNHWLLDSDLRLVDIRERLAELGIKTTTASISRYFRRYCYAELIRRRESAHQAEEIEKHPEAFLRPTIDALAEKACREARKPETSPENLKIFVDLILKLKGQILDELKADLTQRRLRLLEEMKEAEATKRKSRLSDEEFIERMRNALQIEAIPNGQGLLE